MSEPLTPELLLAAYSRGYFPMAEGRNDAEIGWYRPRKRGILPLDAFHIPHSLTKIWRKQPFTITYSRAFDKVIRSCADRVTPTRQETWINEEIIVAYCALWECGHAHSVECWQGETLVGGLYGVSLGGAFFGESMFSLTPNASRIALVALVERLIAQQYTLLDTQYVNEHLHQFGVQEISDGEYQQRLEAALLVNARFIE